MKELAKIQLGVKRPSYLNKTTQLQPTKNDDSNIHAWTWFPVCNQYNPMHQNYCLYFIYIFAVLMGFGWMNKYAITESE